MAFDFMVQYWIKIICDIINNFSGVKHIRWFCSLLVSNAFATILMVWAPNSHVAKVQNATLYSIYNFWMCARENTGESPYRLRPTWCKLKRSVLRPLTSFQRVIPEPILVLSGQVVYANETEVCVAREAEFQDHRYSVTGARAAHAPTANTQHCCDARGDEPELYPFCVIRSINERKWL